jgi:hypothetical protein
MYDSDDDENIDWDGVELTDEEERALFSIEGVKFDLKQNTRDKTIAIIFHAPEDWEWTLFRLYLSICEYKAKMEGEIGIEPEIANEQ